MFEQRIENEINKIKEAKWIKLKKISNNQIKSKP
jgi:hypothetical protein